MKETGLHRRRISLRSTGISRKDASLGEGRGSRALLSTGWLLESRKFIRRELGAGNRLSPARLATGFSRAAED